MWLNINHFVIGQGNVSLLFYVTKLNSHYSDRHHLMNPSTRDWHTMWSGQTSGWWLIHWIRMSTYKLLGISTPSRTKGLVSHRLIKGTVLCMRITSFRNTVVYLSLLISSLMNLILNELFKAVLKQEEPGHIAHLSNNNQHKL